MALRLDPQQLPIERDTTMNALTIANITIKQDEAGRFCLNDFHKAAGGEAKHKPSEWLRNSQTQELVAEIGKVGIPALVTLRGGKTPGTYVCKELVYAYAMWVSPKFHLHVIRTYDQVVQQQVVEANRRAVAAQLEAQSISAQLEYMTLQQYRAMTGVVWAKKHHNSLGTFLGNICRMKGLEIRKFNQSGFLTNSYPVEVINELAEQIGYFPVRAIQVV